MVKMVTAAVAAMALVFCPGGPAIAEDDPSDPGAGLGRFARLDLAMENAFADATPAPVQAGGQSQTQGSTPPPSTGSAPARPQAGGQAAGQPSVSDLKSPTLRKLVEKGILPLEDAFQADREEEARQGKPLSTLAQRLAFSGETYIGYTYTDKQVGSDASDFELRRNYLTLLATLTERMSFRTTLDVTKEAGGGNIEVRIKYAYLYLKEILPKTGVEFGVAHRPWIDYEEHLGWVYRSIERTFIEAPDAADLVSSADLGVNFKPATRFVSAEVGVFNGESYDHLDRTGGQFFSNSIEGRVTAHLMPIITGTPEGGGDSKVNPYKDRYLNVSFNTINNFHLNAGAPGTVIGSSQPASATGKLDRYVYQGHVVLNFPLFLIAAQYIYNQDRFEKVGNQDNWGVSGNGEFRPLYLFDIAPIYKDKIALFGRADYWNVDTFYHDDRKFYLYGVAYRLNPFVRLIVNGITSDHRDTPADDVKDYNKVMFTAELNW